MDIASIVPINIGSRLGGGRLLRACPDSPEDDHEEGQTGAA